nr:response regulator [Rhodospirillales bacterium]
MKQKDQFSIFIADDNEINRILLQFQLEAHCKSLTQAADGKVALDYLQTNKYDLILLDLHMPYLSGRDLIKIIKKADAINNDSPVVAITAHAQKHQRQSLINLGFDECLIKPILYEELSTILDLWLPILPQAKLNQNHNSYTSAILEKTEGNVQLATNLFDKLFAELPTQTQIIENALVTNDFKLAKEVTHRLHGSVSFCGFKEIRSKVINLETSLRENDYQSIQPHFFAVKNQINDFMKARPTIIDALKTLAPNI